MSPKHKAYHVLVVVSILLCIGGFVYNTYDTVVKFIRGGKLVLTTSKSFAKLPLPVLVLCNHTAYKDIQYDNTTIWHQHRYLELTRDPEEILLNLTVHSISRGEYAINYIKNVRCARYTKEDV